MKLKIVGLLIAIIVIALLAIMYKSNKTEAGKKMLAAERERNLPYKDYLLAVDRRTPSPVSDPQI